MKKSPVSFSKGSAVGLKLKTGLCF